MCAFKHCARDKFERESTTMGEYSLDSSSVDFGALLAAVYAEEGGDGGRGGGHVNYPPPQQPLTAEHRKCPNPFNFLSHKMTNVHDLYFC